MKNIIIIFILFSCLCACQSRPEDIIVGAWQLDEIETNQQIEDKDLENFNKAKKEIKASTKLVFKEDYSYKAIIWGDTVNGFWEIDEKNNLLVISNAMTGDTARTKIKEISNSLIILMEEQEGITSVLRFIKI